MCFFCFEDSSRDEEPLTKQNRQKQKDPGSNGENGDGERLKDFYEECVEMSAALAPGHNKHDWFKANSEQRSRGAAEKKLGIPPSVVTDLHNTLWQNRLNLQQSGALSTSQLAERKINMQTLVTDPPHISPPPFINRPAAHLLTLFDEMKFLRFYYLLSHTNSGYQYHSVA